MTPDLCFTAGRERESNARMINGIKKKRKIKGKKKYEVSIRSACLYNMYVRPLLKETRYCYTCLLQISRCSQRVVIFFLFFLCFRFPFYLCNLYVSSFYSDCINFGCSCIYVCVSRSWTFSH